MYYVGKRADATGLKAFLYFYEVRAYRSDSSSGVRRLNYLRSLARMDRVSEISFFFLLFLGARECRHFPLELTILGNGA